MKSSMLIGLVVLGACAPANEGSAETPEPSALVASRPALFAVSSEVPGTVLAYAGGSGGTFAAPPGATLEVRRYRRPPPPARTRRERDIQGWMQVRGGYYDSDDVAKNDWSLGLKAVANIAPSLRLGGSLDLMRRTNSDRTIVTEYVDATGNTVRSETTTGESESNLVPLMVLAEFVMPTTGIQPYFGLAGGWTFLNVQAVDYANGFAYEADYDGPGWQAYVGADFELAPRLRLSTELFHNGATVERRIYDPSLGAAYDERIDVEGNGGRLGLGFAF
jgi:hypothetical protein